MAAFGRSGHCPSEPLGAERCRHHMIAEAASAAAPIPAATSPARFASSQPGRTNSMTSAAGSGSDTVRSPALKVPQKPFMHSE